MKRVLAVSVLLLFLVGCATTATYKATLYNTMQTIGEVYNTSLGTFKDLYDAGQLTPEEYLRGRDLFIEAYDRYQKTVEIIILFERGVAGQGEVDSAIDLMKDLNRQLKEYLAEKLKKGGKT